MSAAVAVPDIPSVCPVCGAYSLAPDRSMSALLAVCDVLVVRALEKIGAFIVRVEGRAAYTYMRNRPLHTAHTHWPTTDDVVTKKLEHAWDVVPAMFDAYGCCGVTSIQVQAMLDEYVHDLVITGTPHDRDELLYRFHARLGLPVYERGEAVANG